MVSKCILREYGNVSSVNEEWWLNSVCDSESDTNTSFSVKLEFSG